MVEFTGTGVVDAPAATVFAIVADLSTYPRWLGIVMNAEREPEADGAGWRVEIGGRVGPLRRTKKLRMIRTEHVEPASVRFERAELDGREHSPWVLAASLAPTKDDNTTEVAMRLHYGGRLPLPGLDLLLGQEVRKAVPRLEALARAAGAY